MKALFFTLLCSTWLFAQEADPVAPLKTEFDRVRAELDKPLTAFYAKYEDQLKKLEAKAAAAGNLDLLLAVQQEAKNYATFTPTIPDSQPELKRLRGIFERNMVKLGSDRNKKLRNLLGSYRKLLRERQNALTRDRKIEQAIAVRNEVGRIDTELTAVQEQLASARPPRIRPGGSGGPGTSPVRQAGRVVAWGQYRDGSAAVPPENPNGYVAVFAGNEHFTALKSNGELVYSGRPDLPHHTLKETLKDVQSVACGRHLSLVLHRDGTVSSWGDHKNYVADTLKEFKNIVSVSAGHSLNVVLDRAGKATVFGYLISHNGKRFPHPEWLTQVEKVRVGTDWIYLVKKDGSLHCADLSGRTAAAPEGFEGKIIDLSGGTSTFCYLLTDQRELVPWRTELPPSIKGKKILAMRSNGGCAAAQFEDGTWTIWGKGALGERMNAAVQAMGPLKDLSLSPYYSPDAHGFFVGIK